MRVPLTSLLCMVLVASAPAAEKPPRDFSAGLERLCMVAGIPDLSQAAPGDVEWALPRTAAWYLLDPGSPALNHGRECQPGDRPRGLRMADWRLGENPDGSIRLLLDGLHAISLYPAGDADRTQLRGRWHGQSRQACLDQLRTNVGRWIEKELVHLGDRDSMPSSRPGQLLLNVACLFAAGRRAEANQLAGMLLSGDGAERVIAGAYCAVAESCYRLAFTKLMRTGDRDAFAGELQDLAKRFPAGWPGRRGTEHVLRKLRATGAVPEALAALPEEDRKLAEELVSGKSHLTLPEVPGWLFYAPMDLPREERNGPLARLLRKGVDALPILFALAEDSRLTVCAADAARWTWRMTLRMPPEVSVPEGLGGRTPLTQEEIGKRVYAGLPHLLTGRQVADRILAQTWHADRRPRDEADDEVRDEDMLESMREWYAAHRGLSGPRLARRMLGEREGRQLAILYLLDLPPTRDDFPAILEAMFMLPWRESTEPLARLAQMRDRQLHSVIERVIRKVKPGREARGVTAELRALFPGEKGTDRITPDAFLSKLDTALAQGSLQGLDSLRSPAWYFVGNADLAGAVLERAAASTIPMHRQALLAILETVAIRQGSRLPWVRPRPMTWEELASEPNRAATDGGGERGRKPSLLKLDLARYAPTWRQVLPRRPIESLLAQGTGTGDGEETEWLFLQMYDPDGAESQYRPGALRMLPGGMEKLLWRRVQTLLDRPGQEPPPWPDADSVPAARIEEIIPALTKLSSTDARQAILALPDSEHLAVLLALREHRDLATRLLLEPRRALPICRFIWGSPPQPLRDVLAPFAGRNLSTRMGEDLLAAAQNVAGKGYPFVAYFQAGPGLSQSFEVAVLDASAEKGTAMATFLKRLPQMVQLGLGPGVHMHVNAVVGWGAFWSSNEGKPGKANPQKGIDDTLIDGGMAREFSEEGTGGEMGGEMGDSEADMGGSMGGGLRESIGGGMGSSSGNGGQREQLRFLKMLDELPEHVLREPRQEVFLLVVALDEETCQRLRKGKSHPAK